MAIFKAGDQSNLESAEWNCSRIIKMLLILAVLKNGRTEKYMKRGNLRPIFNSFFTLRMCGVCVIEVTPMYSRVAFIRTLLFPINVSGQAVSLDQQNKIKNTSMLTTSTLLRKNYNGVLFTPCIIRTTPAYDLHKYLYVCTCLYCFYTIVQIYF